MNRQPRVRVFLRANKFKITFFLVVLRAIYTGMKNHPQFFVTPLVDLATFLSQIDALSAAQQATKSWPRGPATDRDAARDAAYGSAEKLRAYVEGLCNESPEQASQIAQAAGMQIQVAGPRNKPILGVAQLPGGLVELSANAGVLDPGRRGSRFFNWQYSLDGGKSWVGVPSTNKAKATIAGLPALTLIRFRVSVTNSRTGTTDWSNEVPFALT